MELYVRLSLLNPKVTPRLLSVMDKIKKQLKKTKSQVCQKINFVNWKKEKSG